MSTLQDQLLKAGLVTDKQAKQVKKDKSKKAKVQRKSSKPQVDEAKKLAKASMAEKAEKDRLLNAAKNAEAEKHAIAVQIKQLIQLNKINLEGDIAFNFSDGSKVKKIYINDKLQGELSRGQVAIVRSGERYDLVPVQVADKISLRDESVIVFRADRVVGAEADEDPYADYQIPDDLMW